MDYASSSSATRPYEECVEGLKKELAFCNGRVQRMYSAVNEGHSRAFNMEQCKYLVDTLGEVVECSSLFLETTRSTVDGLCSSKGMGNHLVSFKLLLVLAMKIEEFVQGCSKDAWLASAMKLCNILDYVSYLGFHLELCRVVFRRERKACGGLNFDEVVNISKGVSGVVEEKAVVDERALLVRVVLALPSLQGDEKDLAIYLLQRLLRIAPSATSVGSAWSRSQHWTLGFGNAKKKNPIGKGAFGTVFEATWLGVQVAEKVFYGQDNPGFKKEVEVLAGLCHPNITSLFCCTQEKQQSSIVMELMDGDLFHLMKQRGCPPFSMWEAIDMMHQIAEGGKYLDKQKIVHKDLKSMNILVKSTEMLRGKMEYAHVKLTDFNTSRIKTSSITYSEQTMNVGTNRWMAPEVIKLPSSSNEVIVGGSEPSLKYPRKCDIYSFAIVCYEILTGELPFFDLSDPKEMKAEILKGYRPRLPNECPMGLKALIEECWCAEPRSRPSFEEICERLKYMKYELMAGSSSLSKVALEDLNKADEVEALNASTLRKRGDAKRKSGNFLDALKDLNEADKLEPGNALTLQMRGNANRKLCNFTDALKDLDKADVLKPRNAYTLQIRGDVKRLMRNYEGALEDLNKSDEVDRDNVWTLQMRGDVNTKLGKYVDALKDLKEADKREPHSAWTASLLDKLMGMPSH